MIAFQNVSFGYNRRRKVFADLSLTFGEGHIHGLLGRNGTGKSTLLQLICGLLEPDTGHIAVDGFTPRQRSVDFLSRLMLIPEELSLPNIPLRRFASHTGVFYPGYSAEMFESHCEALEIDPSTKSPRHVHGPAQKRLHRFALACNPQFLLLDEPTNGLDIPSKTILRSLLAAYADEKRTIVISTHQVREVGEPDRQNRHPRRTGPCARRNHGRIVAPPHVWAVARRRESDLQHPLVLGRRGHRPQYDRPGKPSGPRTDLRSHHPRPHDHSLDSSHKSHQS